LKKFEEKRKAEEKRSHLGTHTCMAEPSVRPESLLHVILWLEGSVPDLWPSKKRIDFVRASL
jgi:hypothetical protein